MPTVPHLTLTALPNIPSVQPGDNLAEIVCASLKELGELLRAGDILVLAQKIVSKAEGRYVALATVTPSLRAVDLARQVDKDPRLVQLILDESDEVLRHRPGVLIVVHRLGFVLANAGIDSSNVDPAEGERVLLLPKNPDESCRAIRATLRRKLGVDVGVIINDSLGRAWRNGTVGTALGISGVPGLLDLRGRPDRNGRTLRVTEIGAADEVAAAASLLMGQAAEGRPIILVRGFPYDRREGAGTELIRPKELDLFR
jgi:coenzyme F420-0:L-glutamate ligase/coenzyme F420-1:gamma-L-glutamate ligase